MSPKMLLSHLSCLTTIILVIWTALATYQRFFLCISVFLPWDLTNFLLIFFRVWHNDFLVKQVVIGFDMIKDLFNLLNLKE